MQLSIVHSLPNRVRFKYPKYTLDNKQVIVLKNMLIIQNGIESVFINSLTCSILVCYNNINENDVLSLILNIEDKYMHDKAILKSTTEEEHRLTLFSKLTIMLLSHFFKKLLPIHIRHAITIIKAVYRVKLALEKFRQTKKLQSETIDATSLTISILNDDYSSASNIAFLLDVSEVLEDYAKKYQ